jgi:hypothetical protein
MKPRGTQGFFLWLGRLAKRDHTAAARTTTLKLVMCLTPMRCRTKLDALADGEVDLGNQQDEPQYTGERFSPVVAVSLGGGYVQLSGSRGPEKVTTIRLTLKYHPDRILKAI